MANEAHDPWALLAAARGSVLQHKERLLDCDHEDDCTCDLAAQKIVLLDRIDAALAEHADSATPVVESDDLWWTPSSHRAQERKCDLHVWRISLKEWGWSTTIYREHERGREDLGSGVCATLDEAQRAALAAARGLK